MLSAFGAWILWVWPFVMTNVLVSTYSFPRLSQSALLVMTASTLTRSQVSLSRIRVAVWLEPEEQAATTSTAESHAGYRFTVRLLLEIIATGSRIEPNLRSFKNLTRAVQAEFPPPRRGILWVRRFDGQNWVRQRNIHDNVANRPHCGRAHPWFSRSCRCCCAGRKVPRVFGGATARGGDAVRPR